MSRVLDSLHNRPLLSPGEVHVWFASLNSDSVKAEAQGAFLSEDEMDRAGRFVFGPDRVRYVAARGILRCLLGGYLNIDPAEIRFSYGACGKPKLTGRLAGRLRFNLSHAGDRVAYALSVDREVGIDIEPMRNDIPWEQLAPLVFSANEQAEFADIPRHEKARAFLRGWTRKEAYVKGCGEGLSLSLDAFDVPLGSFEGQGPVDIRNAPGRSSGWRLYPLELIHGLASALAVKGAPAQVALCRRAGCTATTKPATAVRSRAADSIEFPDTDGSIRGSDGSRRKDLRNRPEGVWKI